MDTASLRIGQLAGMASMQYADVMHAKSSKVADVYKSTLNEIFIQKDDSFISHTLREYHATHTQSSLTNITFQAQLLLNI